MVKIRLTRIGKKKRPFYRVIATDSRAPRNSRAIEQLGWYDPLKEPSAVKLDLERVDYWIGVGAQPTDTVARLIQQARTESGAEAAS